MAVHADTGRLAPSRRARTEPALERIIAEVAQGAEFALPGPLCGPVFHHADQDGVAARVLMAMMWIASDTLKRGNEVAFQAPLSDLRHAAGLTRHNGNPPVRRALNLLEGEKCIFPDGEAMPVFRSLRIVRYKDLDLAEWEFGHDLSALFDHPARFSILSIRDMADLVKGIDIFLYREAMLVKNMRRPKFQLPAVDLHRVCGIGGDRPFKRVVERIRRSIGRVEKAAGIKVAVEPIQERGSRCLAGLSFTVASDKETPA